MNAKHDFTRCPRCKRKHGKSYALKDTHRLCSTCVEVILAEGLEYKRRHNKGRVDEYWLHGRYSDSPPPAAPINHLLKTAGFERL